MAIPLSQGKIALVDTDDATWVNQFKWYAKRDQTTWYAMRGIVRGGVLKIVRMHRFILEAPDNVEVDHINRDGLDNRRSNLRFASRIGNITNRGMHRNNRSGFKGVYLLKGLWAASVGGHYLGRYDSAIEAARAYDTEARRRYGEFARLNFPDDHITVEARYGALVRNSTSGYRGVSFRKSNDKWVARLAFRGRRLFLGYFTTKEEAARAWDSRAIELLGPTARLNFPD